MSECGCVGLDSGDYDSCTVYNEKDRKARKPHKCLECGRIIEPGEIYIYGSGIFDHAPFNHATCADCQSVIKEFFCGGREFGTVWEHVCEHINARSGEIPSDCLGRLTKNAQLRFVEKIDEYLEDE